MAAINQRFGTGGSSLTPGGSAGKPALADALRDIADDLSALQPRAVATANASATYGANEQALLNELKARVNAVAAAVLKTTKA